MIASHVHCRYPFQVSGTTGYSVQETELILGPTDSGSVCNQDLEAASQILQLEARSAGRSDRCIRAGSQRLCEPILVTDREMYSAHQEPEGHCGAST